MADRFDRVDNRGGGGFVMGLLTGTALGAGLGMLFAPKAGAELRGQLSEQAGTLPSTATEGYRKATEIAGETGKSLLGVAREAVKNGTDEAQRYVRDAARGVTGTPPMFPGGIPLGPANRWVSAPVPSRAPASAQRARAAPVRVRPAPAAAPVPPAARGRASTGSSMHVGQPKRSVFHVNDHVGRALRS
jgi:gas vesicle protein